MKILMLLIMSFFLLTLPQDDMKTTFLDRVSTQYDRYTMVEDYSSPDYYLVVVRGIANDEPSYGVMFFSTRAKSHSLMLTTGSTKYTLPTTKRGDVSVSLIKNTRDIVLEIYDEAQTVRKTIELDAISIDEFDTSYPTPLLGAGEGGRVTSLIRKVTLLDIIIWISLGIILLSSALIFFLYRTKRGVFNPNRKLNYQINLTHRGFPTDVESDSTTTQEEEPQEEQPQEDEPQKDEPLPTKSSSFVNQYEALYGEDDDEEPSISDVLLRNGISEEYELLSPHEKNNVMLKLMYLRDKKDITLAQYQKEVIKLWKKSV